MNDFEQALLESEALEPLPTAARELLELELDAAPERISGAVAADAALAERVLELLNSRAWGSRHSFAALRDASTLLGGEAVRNIALTFCYLDTVRRGPGGALRDALCRTAVMKALAAHRLAGAVGGWQPEEALLAGAASTAGAFFLLGHLPAYPDVLRKFFAGTRSLTSLERESLDTSHAVVGPRILGRWQLPARVIDPIRQHHGILVFDGDVARRGQILEGAENMATTLTIDARAERVLSLDGEVSETVGVSMSRACSIAAALPEQLRAAASIFAVSGVGIARWEELVERGRRRTPEARTELDNGLRSAAFLAEDDFRSDAPHQGLDRMSFEHLLEAFHHRARQLRRPLGLVILQVENLKRLEDDYGPEAAEETMSEVGRRLAKVVRRSDPSGRIDDDQVAVLAPGCDREDLPGVAERVRQRVEHDAVETSAGSLKIELAAGSGSSRPHHDGIDPLALLDGARQDLGSQS